MINVLPQNEKQLLRKEYQLRLLSVCLLLVTIIGVFASVALFPSYVASKNKETLLEAKLMELNKTNPDISITDLDAAIKKINNSLVVLSANKSRRVVSQDVLDPLLALRTKGIQLGQILYTERPDGVVLMDVHGVASNRVTLQEFKAALTASGKFTTVDLPISNFVQKSNINFTITIIIK